MKPLTKSIIGLIIFITAAFIAVDIIPAETKGSMGTVIHKTISPVPPELQDISKPNYILIVWAENEYQPLRVTADEEEWDDTNVGDKLMIYFRDGWITDFNYSLEIQGDFEQL